MGQRSSGEWQRSYYDQRNPTWQRSYNDQRNPTWQIPYMNRSSPYEMENRWNVICTICHNYGHVAMNCRRRTGRGNVGPWRESGMAYFHCHKPEHLAKFCKAKMNKPVNLSVD